MKPQDENPKHETEELSYEKLKDVAIQLQQQNAQMREALENTNYTNMFKRLDYLFKIIENAPMFKTEFVEKCTVEIEAFMTLPEEPKSEEGTVTTAKKE